MGLRILPNVQAQAANRETVTEGNRLSHPKCIRCSIQCLGGFDKLMTTLLVLSITALIALLLDAAGMRGPQA